MADVVGKAVTEALIMAKVMGEGVTEALVVAERHGRDRGGNSSCTAWPRYGPYLSEENQVHGDQVYCARWVKNLTELQTNIDLNELV